ncbi:hypothetical protein A9Q78_11175 [Methylophaga sp. 41_12_T18]|nr:hypothetical protein A9Q78_11175 [Methylophaga sp. 41_12_T18]
MIPFNKYLLMLLLLAMLAPTRQLLAVTPEPVSDVRILIDVSGSMKKNDPNNLRSPALRLVVGLLPDDSKAGVWTFAKYVNMLVPIREVNEAWKIEAERQSNNIHSYGLFTNIEQALNKATASHKTADETVRRSVILLSDGLVDVSKDESVSKKSRQRILDTLVPRLKKNGVAVHTIALSANADHDLLRAISIATDGWYEQVDTADELQRVFLHLFEKAAQRDTVPLTDNNFQIDDSVSEMTLLVFRQQDTRETQLVMPDKSRLNRDELPSTVRWHHEDSYDLITIDNPLVGGWKIDADLDPDNRVMVVTDLKLQTTDLPNNILIGETFDFEASLTEKGEVIVRQDFLNLVDAELKEENEMADALLSELNSQQQQGVYRANIGDSFQPGRNDVVITTRSATFERQRRQSINVVETPFEVQIEQLTEEATRTHRITLKPDVELIKRENLSIAAMLTAPDGSEWSYDVMINADDNWQLTLADLQPGDNYSLALQIRGETVKGRSLFLQPSPIVLIDRDKPEQEKPELELPEIDEPAVEESIIDEPVDEDVDELAMDGQDNLEAAIDDELDSLLIEADDDLFPEIEIDESMQPEAASSVTLIIGNFIIILLVGIGVFVWRRKSAVANPGDEL